MIMANNAHAASFTLSVENLVRWRLNQRLNDVSAGNVSYTNYATAPAGNPV